MKYVIDIPEEVKEKIAIMGLDRLDVWNIRLVSKAISDGTPLDKIRAEIKSKKFGLTDTEDGRRIQSDIHAGFDGGIECALQIIDKYKEESEEKE